MASPSNQNNEQIKSENQSLTSSKENRVAEKEDSKTSGNPASKSLLEGNGFKVIKKIGSGSYSKVKLAYSESHKSMVAVKIVSKYHVPDEFLRKFLYNEVKVVKFLKHENIIKYYQSIESSHRLYVVMQHAEKGSILDLIHKERKLTEARACNYFRQITAGIDYIHSQGVCHRDIKCENILLDENYVVKIIDFGFARSYRDDVKPVEEKINSIVSNSPVSSSSSTKRKGNEKDPKVSETYCGSYAYASPEILKGIPYDPFLSDVWAMGCVLYAMVFGRLPFDDRDPSKLIKQVQSTIHFPSSVESSEELKNCIRRILSPLKNRYNIAALKEDSWFTTAHLNEQSPPERKISTR